MKFSTRKFCGCLTWVPHIRGPRRAASTRGGEDICAMFADVGTRSRPMCLDGQSRRRRRCCASSTAVEAAAFRPGIIAAQKDPGFSPGTRRRRALNAVRCTLYALLASCVLSPLSGQQSPPPQTETPRFHVNVRLVDVFVNVTDADGAPVGGLSQTDFQLAEDGVPQKITYFERQTDMPLSLILAIDTSGSVRKDFDVEKREAREFMRALLRPVDGMDLFDFNSDVREVVPFTANIHRLDEGLADLATGPATDLYDAVYLASERLAQRHGRKVLVVISDGDNTVKGVDFSEALEEAVRSEVMVYSLIDLPILNDAGRDTGGEHALITLSQGTGGKFFYAQFGDWTAAFQKISEDLRTQYLIGYYPVQRRSLSDFRRIRVTLAPTAKTPHPTTDLLRYRPGYYAPASPPLDQ
jgi:Ca-activated chloride channel homolog